MTFRIKTSRRCSNARSAPCGPACTVPAGCSSGRCGIWPWTMGSCLTPSGRERREHGVRYQAVAEVRVPALEQVRADDPEVVVGDVRERGPALHVAQGVDARHAGLESLVHLDEAVLVGLDAGGPQVEGLAIG